MKKYQKKNIYALHTSDYNYIYRDRERERHIRQKQEDRKYM